MDNFTGLSSSVIKTHGIIHLSPLNKQKTADATRMHESDTHIKCHYESGAVHIYSTCNFLIKYNAYFVDNQYKPSTLIKSIYCITFNHIVIHCSKLGTFTQIQFLSDICPTLCNFQI